MHNPNKAPIKLVSGLSDPVTEGQVIFRNVLKAMSEPGSILNITEGNGVDILHPSAFALTLALMDQHTTLWLSQYFDKKDIIKNLQFHTGVKQTHDPCTATFAIARPNDIKDYSLFNTGSDESPELSCSLFLQVDTISQTSNHANDNLTEIILSGPGIQTSQTLFISDLNSQLLDYLVDRPTPFPQGLDFYFISEKQLLCIPRTTKVVIIKGAKTPCM